MRAETEKGVTSRERMYRTALSVLRKRGYDRATMREIAGATGMSLGAVYHYFPSKDAIVMAYYEESAQLHESATRERWRTATTFAERLDAIFQSKLELAAADRKLLGVLFRSVGDPQHPLSPFSKKTQAIRHRNIALFEQLFDDEPAGARRTPARALWLVHLGLLLMLLYDPSDGKRTSKVAHELAGWLAPLVRSPLAGPFLARLERMFPME